MRIIELVEDDENYYIVSELLKGGELFKRLLTCRSFTELQASQIVLHLLEGLNYMHLQCVTHRDLKPENILLVSERKDVFDIKIADLGFAQKFEKDKGLDLVLGTPLYMAPELVRQQRYSEKVDVWSLGCIVYQLLCGSTPFDGKSLKKINYNICQKPLQAIFEDPQWRAVSDDAKDFILQCLVRDHEERPAVADLLHHPWITAIPDVEQDETIQLNIQKNLVEHQMHSDFQKIVLSLISGLSASEDQLTSLQKEFIRLDRDKSGTLTKEELEEMTSTKLVDRYDLDWEAILDECDTNRDGVIDFEEFISACIDKKVLSSTDDLHKAFNLLDTNHDGVISLDDFDDLFCSYGGAKMDQDLWHELLMEADRNDDGKVSFDEFRDAMSYLLTKNLEKKRRNTAQR